MRKRNEGILDDLVMEILRVLSSPDIDVRGKALSIAMEMISSKNVEEVVLLLKKELSKTIDEQYEKVGCAIHIEARDANYSGTLEYRISAVAHSLYSSMCHQVF